MLKFTDLNKELVDAIDNIGIEAIHGDYFLTAYQTQRPVLMTASNPMWTFGGGIDAVFKRHFPELVRYKQIKSGGQERIANICFCITVDSSYKATPEIIESALQFAMENTGKDETLLLSGIGTGIGGLDISTFIEILKNVTRASQ